MLAENLGDTFFRPQFDQIPLGSTIPSIIAFIEKVLPDFSGECIGKGYNEEELSQVLFAHLQQASKTEVPFRFIPEPRRLSAIGQERQKRPDFGVIPSESRLGRELIFALEAKRLPTPGSLKRKKEYVMGSKQNGGIERFKRELHGKGLTHCGIIGYVENDDFEFWQREINNWIKDLSTNNTDSTITWHEVEQLLEDGHSTGLSNRYISTHTRQVSNVILHHLWVKLQC